MDFKLPINFRVLYEDKEQKTKPGKTGRYKSMS